MSTIVDEKLKLQLGAKEYNRRMEAAKQADKQVLDELDALTPATTQAEAEVERRVDYFDSEEVREHVRESKHCQHGLGFTYDFCPIINQVNQHEHLKQRIAELEAALRQACRIVSDRAAGGRMIWTQKEAQEVLKQAIAVLNRKEGE